MPPVPPVTIADIDVAGKRVLMRVDFNVPLDDGGAITDDRRIRQAMPSIESVLRRGGRLVLMSHLGRPSAAGVEPALSLRPAADRLRALLGATTVHFVAGDCAGAAAAAAVTTLGDGEIVLLDNLRFDPGEKSGDADFAARLAAFGEVYCNDAFGTAHRSDASMVAVPAAMGDCPKVAGLLLADELGFFGKLLENPARPFVAVIGGAKVSDKLAALRNLKGMVDVILIGGAMAYTFLESFGAAVGSSLVEPALLDEARTILQGPGRTISYYPFDHRCGRAIKPGTPVEVFEAIPDGWMGLDIGPGTADRFAEMIAAARTIVWNGPMGVFEMPPFDTGSRQVALAMASATDDGAVTVVGGGDTAAAVERFGLADRFSHVSTGGGASLRMLEGKRFESVDQLDGY
jgi:phosphoglycerate kinase